MPSFTPEGTFTALVTPFVRPESSGAYADPAIDWNALETLVERQITGGIDGLVPCGTTGESPAMSYEEQLEVIQRTVNASRGRVPVLAGAGAPSTSSAIHLAKQAEKAGADAIMVVVPYYNRPTQDGLLAHFTAVAGSVGLPVVLYNVPGRTGADMTAETIARIAERAANVVAVKEATGNVLRTQEILGLCGDRLKVLSGDDALTLPAMAVGARGVISVTSNLLPTDVAKATRLALRGEQRAAQVLHQAMLPVHRAMFVEANPSPVKAALARDGVMSDAVRLPLVPATESAKQAIFRAVDTYRASQK